MYPSIVLASASPRRREILDTAGIPYRVQPADIEEIIPPGASPEEAVKALAAQKAAAVAALEPGALVLGADTVVSLDGAILGKPRGRDDAIRMLTMLSGRTHTVYTGVSVTGKGITRTFSCATQVTFYPLSPEEIEAYAATGEPLDKAGAYGIQGRGCVLVERIEGDYFNVMGLPIAQTARLLRTFCPAHAKTV